MESAPAEAECFNEIWSKSIEEDSFLPGAQGPHMGMGVTPPDQPRAIARRIGVFEGRGDVHRNATPQDEDRQSLCTLPRDVVVRLILEHFGPKQLILSGQVCHEWSVLSDTPSLWRNLFFHVKFWRIWYNEPTDWKSEFQRRHTQEVAGDESPGDSSPGAASEEMPFWHRQWHGGGNGVTEGVPLVSVSGTTVPAGVDEEGTPVRQFSTIQEAVDNVDAGTRIVVEPGEYQEHLHVDKMVEIVGRGGMGQKVTVNGNVSIDGAVARLGNLNIRTQPTDDNEGSIQITDGSQASVEDCDILGSVILDGAAAVVRNNRIHNGLQSGVLVKGGSGVITNNNITEHQMCGIILKGDANPVVRNNTFASNNLAGIVIGDEAGGTFEGNRTVQNSHYGVAVGASAEPRLRGNFCQENGMGGMLASGNSGGTFENNDFSENNGHGMVLAGSNKAVVVGNTFRNNGEAGMALCGDSRPSVEDNHVAKNNGPGVIIQDTSEPTVRRNQLRTNAREGIVVLDSGGGTIEHNRVSSNKCAGVVLNGDATSTLRSNTVSKNFGAGIVVRDSAQTEIVQNKVSENEMGGVSIHDQAQITLTENLVCHNQSTGVELADQTECHAEKNHIIGNSMSGIETFGDSSQTFRENKVSRNAQAGFVMGSTSDSVVLEDNTFKNNTVSEIVIQNKANPPAVLKNNTCSPHIPATRRHGSSHVDVAAMVQARLQDMPSICPENDLIGPVGIGRGQVVPVHMARSPSKLFVFAANHCKTPVLLTFEIWQNSRRQQFNLNCEPCTTPQVLIPGVSVEPPDDVWCYAPVQGVPKGFDPDKLVIYGFCLDGREKAALTPSTQDVSKERVGSTQARYERNTGCDLDSLSE